MPNRQKRIKPRGLGFKIQKFLYALYDAKGELAMVYDTFKEADEDAVGPRFRPTYTIVTYQAVEVVQNKADGGQISVCRLSMG